MLSARVIFILFWMIVLVVCLRIQWSRWMKPEQYLNEERHWTGKGINVADLRPRIDALRVNYLAARPTVRGVCFHKALLALARRAVVQLPFFQQRKSGS